MNNVLAKTKIDRWDAVSRKLGNNVLLWQSLTFLVVMTTTNPFFYKSVGLLRLDFILSKDLHVFSATFSAMAVFAYIVLVYGFVFLMAMTKRHSITNSYDEEMNEKLNLKLNVVPAQKLLTLKPVLFESGEYTVVYEIAETNQLFASKSLVKRKSKYSAMVLGAISIVANAMIISISSGGVDAAISYIHLFVGYGLVVTLAAVVTAVVLSSVTWRRQNKELLAIANGVGAKHYCEYSVLIEHGDKNTSVSLNGLDSKEVIDIKHLEKINMSAIGLEIKQLSAETYAAMDAINNSELNLSADNRTREFDIEVLEGIANNYLPACIKEISKHQRNAGSGTITESAKKGYEVLLDNITTQLSKVQEIKKPYVEASEKLLAVEITRAIDTAVDKIESIDSPEMSLSTSFISNKLETELIPDIQQKMIGASATDIEKLELRIEKARKLIKDKERLETTSNSRDVFISEKPTEKRQGKSQIDSYIMYLDSYLDSLKKDW